MPVPSWALRLRPAPVPVCRVRAAAARGRADADDGPGPRARGRALLAAWSRIQDPGSGVLPLLPPTWSPVRAWLHGGPGPVERSGGFLISIPCGLAARTIRPAQASTPRRKEVLSSEGLHHAGCF